MTTFEEYQREVERRTALTADVRYAMERIAAEDWLREKSEEWQRHEEQRKNYREHYRLGPGEEKPGLFRRLYFDHIEPIRSVLGEIARKEPPQFVALVVLGPPVLLLWLAAQVFVIKPAKAVHDCLEILTWILAALLGFTLAVSLAGIVFYLGCLVTRGEESRIVRFVGYAIENIQNGRPAAEQ